MREKPHLPDDVSDNPHQPELKGPAPITQWLAMFLAPAVFLVHLQANYLLVMYACGTDLGMALVHATAVLAILIGAAGCWAGWLAWRRAGGVESDDGIGAIPRTRMMGVVGLGVSALLVLILIAQLVASVITPPCE
jgi:hypothetical protein